MSERLRSATQDVSSSHGESHMGSNPILCIYRYGLVVRIEGLHPSGPGSIPGIGILRSWFSGRMLPFQGSDPGSIPGGRTFYRRSSAGLEHRPFKPRVAGSNPADGVSSQNNQ